MKILKKFGTAIVAFLGGVLAVVLIVFGMRKNRGKKKQLKADIKASEVKEKDIENKIDAAKEVKNHIEDNILDSEDKVKDLENKIDSVKSDEKDITKATDFLKDFASKNGSSKKKNP